MEHPDTVSPASARLDQLSHLYNGAYGRIVRHLVFCGTEFPRPSRCRNEEDGSEDQQQTLRIGKAGFGHLFAVSIGGRNIRSAKTLTFCKTAGSRFTGES